MPLSVKLIKLKNSQNHEKISYPDEFNHKLPIQALKSYYFH